MKYSERFLNIFNRFVFIQGVEFPIIA